MSKVIGIDLGTTNSVVSVAAGILKLKDASLALAADPNGITRGDCSSLLAEVASYFDRAAAAVS